MTVGSTWKAKKNPIDERCAPSSPKTNFDPTKAKLSSQFTPSPAFWKSTRPISTLRTKMANATCRPSPHPTVFRRIAFRLLEKMEARPNIVIRPRMPENRPINVPLYRSHDESAKACAPEVQQRFCSFLRAVSSRARPAPRNDNESRRVLRQLQRDRRSF